MNRESQKSVSFTYFATAVTLLIAAVIWTYWTTLSAMAYKWENDPQYSQGYLVPLFALVLLYLRRHLLRQLTFRSDWRGLPVILLGVGIHVACGYLNVDWVDGASILITVAGCFLLVGGVGALKWAWPSVFFLIFMVPLPYTVETSLAYPLQRMATLGSAFLLQTIGYPAIAEGNVIFLSQSRIGVVEACSGLSMLLIFFAIATAIVILYQPPLLDRIVLLLSAVPIALLVNILRITATGMAQEEFGVEAAEKIFHDWAGWLMMPAAFGFLALEVWLLKRLFPVVDDSPKKPMSVPGLRRQVPFAMPKRR